MSRARNILLACLVAVALVAITLAAGSSGQLAFADVNSFQFKSFHAEYLLSKNADGTAHVLTTETIVPVFPDFDQNRGIVRTLETSYDGVPLNTNVSSVSDASGHAVPFSTVTDQGLIKVAIGTDAYVHGQQTYVLTYEQDNVVRSFADTKAQEFYWDVNGTNWRQRFGEVTANMTVGPSLARSLTGNAACYQGKQGSTSRCVSATRVEDGSTIVSGASQAALNPGETMTVAVGFRQGTFVVPTAPSQSFGATVLPAALGAIGLLATIALLVIRRIRWRDAPGRGTIIPEYQPPREVDLLEASTVIRESGNPVVATLVRLAVAGNVRILDTGGRKAGHSERERFSVELVHREALSASETGVMTALFGAAAPTGTVVELTAPDAERGRAIAAVLSKARRGMVARGFRALPKRPLSGWAVSASLGFSIAALVVALVCTMLGASNAITVAVWIVSLVSIAAHIAIRVKPKLLTETGATLRDYLNGTKIYLELAEADRLKMLQSVEGAERVVTDAALRVKLYERMLPLAVLWGIERSWSETVARAFAEADEKPTWVVSPYPTTDIALVSLMHALPERVGTATADPSSASSGGGSFSGGSMGGGFAGGGGGGGGGGGR